MKRNVIIAAGGSGGHLLPAEALAVRLQSEYNVLIAGHRVEQSVFLTQQIPTCNIEAALLKKRHIFRFAISTLRGFFQSIRLLFRTSPDLVIGFGSYHSFPLMLAAICLRKKIVLFEANCALGKVNRLFAPFATYVALQFPIGRFLKQSVFVDLFVQRKQEILQSKQEALSYFGLKPNLPTILVFGGSQGAKIFNEVMPEALKEMDVQVIHLSGKGDVFYENPSCVKVFERRMDLAYMAADLVISRSGAMTLSELIAYQKPSLLIPYPFASEGHQAKNAHFLSDQIKGARILLQDQLSVSKVKEEVKSLLNGLSVYEAHLKKYSSEVRSDFVEIIKKILK